MAGCTPLEALYALFKGEFGLSHRAFSELILSDRPFQNGATPQQMAANTSWLSRYVVHAPADSLQPRLFADFPASARRVHSHLIQLGRSDRDVFAAIFASDLMPRALCDVDQSGLVYRNALARLEPLPADLDAVKARAALLLTISAGCTANVGLAVDLASSYIRSDGRVQGRLTPSPIPVPARAAAPATPEQAPDSIGLIRLVDGRVASNPYVVPGTAAGAIVGALALGEHAIADVEPDVSAEHLRVYREGDRWLVCDLGSRNGTALLPADGGSARRLAPNTPVELRPGDSLQLASRTIFVVVAMARNPRGGVSLMTTSPADRPTAAACAAARPVPATQKPGA